MKKLIILLPFLLCACFEDQWQEQDKCQLIQKVFKGSTLKNDGVPSITMNGQLAIGVVTTGEGEKHVTIWECEKLGTMTSIDDEVFRLAQNQETLVIAKNWNGKIVIRKVLR